MQIGARMLDALNVQIGREFFAALQYVSMGAWFDGAGLPGFSKFFFHQAEEENEHALKLVRYVGEVGGQVAIPALEAPRREWPGVEAALRAFLEAEEDVTRRIHALVDLALGEKDHTSLQVLQLFVEGQREGVSSAQ